MCSTSRASWPGRTARWCWPTTAPTWSRWRSRAAATARAWGPPWVGDQSAYFLAANRNKRSITVDLKASEGRQIIHALAAQSDVVIENFKVGGAAKLGLDYATLAAPQPAPGLLLDHRLRADWAVQRPRRLRLHHPGAGRLMSITGPEQGEPYKVGVAIADITAGLFAATAILAALHERERSGQGQAIDVALLDAQIAWLANVAQNYLATGEPPGRFGNAHPSIVPYEPFPTADGAVAVAVGTDEQYRRLCLAAGRADLCEDERFRTNAGRVTHRAALIPLLRALFRTRSTQAWVELLLAIGVPVGEINTVAQALENPQVRARAMVQEVEHPTAGRIKLLGPAVKFSRSALPVAAPPPLGHDTAAVLRERLGCSDDEIADLRRQEAI
jgi:crotonobetainyl-CoA:carnitine CoA-transferase CaiB-like acyl-CoA transferase